jgi:hypothetical protein
MAGADAESPLAYWVFRDRLAAAIRTGHVRGSAAAMLDHAAITWRINRAIAGEWVERFMGHLGRDLARRRSTLNAKPRHF